MDSHVEVSLHFSGNVFLLSIILLDSLLLRKTSMGAIGDQSLSQIFEDSLDGEVIAE